ncbi:putative amidohydrolase [Stella humosa]|uniref:Putative amidohydrolase n=1 Tax=Stella humosa TaxID=94 RepID=A0A3N1M8H1_9PROT|nr:carbon-nitrogen hydrolase family protein [Stella humosa]ROP99987.1 putative amidohydrolase [Stella humosa]BBK30782.1 amidohydrolase [Stella humosa]
MSTTFKAACIQMTTARDMAPNIDTIASLTRQARSAGADLVMTPEVSNMIEPDRKAQLAKVRFEGDDPMLAAGRDLARETGVWLLLGSLAVKAEGEERLANRSFLLSPAGEIVARYDKIHMFDVDLAGGESYRESNRFRPGEQAVVADLPWGRLGMTICYDMRFAYLYRALAHAGATMLSVPAAFTVPTGRAHWHTLLRARAIETGCYVFAPAQTGEHAEGRRTYGHSLIISPWGEVLADAEEAVGFVMAEIDPAKVVEARRMVPALGHDRPFALPGQPIARAAE